MNKLLKHAQSTKPSINNTKMATSPTTIYQTVPQYITISKAQTKLVGLIASAIVAGDQAKTQTKVKQVEQLNPEYRLVALIATSVVAAAQPESQFMIKTIEKKRSKAHVTQI